MQDDVFDVKLEVQSNIKKCNKVLKQMLTLFTTFIHFQCSKVFICYQFSSMLTISPCDRIFIHAIEYYFNMAKYISRIFYLCGNEYFENIFLGS
jgi:hypothetical protein